MTDQVYHCRFLVVLSELRLVTRLLIKHTFISEQPLNFTNVLHKVSSHWFFGVM